jgi:hypothetical protein
MGVKSGDSGGQAVVPPRPIQTTIAKPSQTKILNKGGDMYEEQVNATLLAIHACEYIAGN